MYFNTNLVSTLSPRRGVKRAVIEHISKIGEREFREFTITKRRLKQVKAIEMVRQAREEGNQSIGYGMRTC